ncbi:MAG: adenosylmethionine decarboxylase [Candidatus Omnitrophica bacterium]|nr:adenosylmethionine decarboxylase [Candidatus Omnitrophota bacterium]MDD5080675.1 adenosylmethionine decarboxylase [Candidatus Omnitrophota bacterium]MDD5440668.1 adenosylmethionine decarboxylase [Candidatus Omnitrophota bacterium]
MKKKEYCCTNGCVRYAGVHLILEIRDAANLSSLPKVRKALQDSVKAIGATLLGIDLHKFSPSGGISGMAIISESHLSIHSWPEYGYAALDVFTCGDVNPYDALPILKKAFKTNNVQITEFKRGIF